MKKIIKKSLLLMLIGGMVLPSSLYPYPSRRSFDSAINTVEGVESFLKLIRFIIYSSREEKGAAVGILGGMMTAFGLIMGYERYCRKHFIPFDGTKIFVGIMGILLLGGLGGIAGAKIGHLTRQ